MMASSAAGPRQPYDFIDLVSDDSDSESSFTMERRRAGDQQHLQGVDYVDADVYQPPAGHPRRAQNLNAEAPNSDDAQGGIYVDIDGEAVFIPDEEPEQPTQAAITTLRADATTLRDREIAMGLQQPEQAHGAFPAAAAVEDDTVMRDHEVALELDEQAMTADECLQRVLDVFPDISHEYVTKMYDDFATENDYEALPGRARLDNIIEQLLSAASYPKQEKGKLKRKREASIDQADAKKWERQDRGPTPNFVANSIRSMLKAEFPEIPVNYIHAIQKQHEHFYQSYIALTKARDSNDGSARSFGKGRPSKVNLADADTIAMNCGWPELVEELSAARQKVQLIKADKVLEEAKKQAEKDNLEKAIAAGETAECTACFDDLPMNRQIHCNGSVAHFTCYECALTYVKTEVGESRCRVLCTAGCGAGFAHDQLSLLSDKQLLEKLAQLQQEKDIRDAGLEDLEECPFCDYKAILPPIEEDFEFRCANPECEKVSCRRCKSISHIPMSCEQHAKDNKINSRHKIEEAMTAALIRSCNKCKKQFIKEYGCNKMSCSSCGNAQCYVCSASLKDYNHFDQGPAGNVAGAARGGAGKCPLYDNVEERHEREVKEAEATARAQVVSENPDVSVEDLEIKVSDAVKKATEDRIRQAHGPIGAVVGFGLDMGAHMFEPLGAFGALPPQHERMAIRARQQQQRVAQQQARLAAVRTQREIRAEQARQQMAVVQARQAQPNQQQHDGGFMGRLQGFIPVYGLQQAPARIPQEQPGAAGQAPQARPNPFGVLGQPNLNLDDPFTGPRFGGDGAADNNRPQHMNQAPANNNADHLRMVNPFEHLNPQLGPHARAWPARAPNAARADYDQQLRLLELDNLRREHDRQVQIAAQQQQINNLQQQQQQQIQQRLEHLQAHQRGRRAGNNHYEGYEEEMRRMGFPPGR